MKDLILVESPTKAKTLSTFLKGKFDIEASFGHVRDLPKSKLGIDVEHDFEPQYEVSADKKKVIAMLKKKVKTANRVILATDPDREGEAISHHLYELLKKDAKKSTTFSRIVFHEITPEAIQVALDHPGKINDDLVSAQTARRVLDRIVGYKLSPLLWKKVKTGLSAGRVQSIALRLMVEREREIKKFEKSVYFRIFVVLDKTKKEEAELELVEIDGKKIESSTKLTLYDGEYKYAQTIFVTEIDVQELLESLKSAAYTVAEVIKKDTKRSPGPPFITSSLQQEASRRFGFTGKRTMSVAQKLYENGLISYHRTDSFNLSNQFLTRARAFVAKEYGEKYLVPTTRVYSKKTKNAQEAHEAIRPTQGSDLSGLKMKAAAAVGPDGAKLFDLIFKRAVATQMADAIFESTSVTVDAEKDKKKYIFKKNGLVLKFDGFLKIWFYDGEEALLPDFEQGEKLVYKSSKSTTHETNPPPRYNDASIIGALEKHGIGRPSTYASIISTIQDRGYVERIEGGRFVPTPIGDSVNDFLVANFGDIDDIPFTASMEDKLDDVANGDEKWVELIRDFYTPLSKKLGDAEGADRVKIESELTDKKCPKCGKPVAIKYGKFGKFLACTGFPDCDYRATYAEETDRLCPKDSGKIVAKKTRKSRIFYGCINYPNCDFAAWKLEDIPKTPEAEAVKN
jgi:DNA topoisomerase I